MHLRDGGRVDGQLHDGTDDEPGARGRVHGHTANSPDLMGQDTTAVRGAIHWEPTPALTADVFVNYQKDDSTGTQFTSGFFPVNGEVNPYGPTAMNINAEQARWEGRHIPLSRNGFRVLRYLAENPNRIITRRELIEALGKGGDPDYLRTVDVWIKRLRAGLKEVGASHALRTVQAKGYVLDLP